MTKKIFFPIIVLMVLLFISTLAGCQAFKPDFSQAIAAKTPDEEVVQAPSAGLEPAVAEPVNQEPISITLALVGDIMVHQSQLNAALDKKTGQYNFSDYFQSVRNYLQEADLTIGNLETTVAGKNRGYSGYPVFNTPAQLLLAAKEAGFDVLTNANNHSMDRGASGVLATIQQLEQAGLKHAGTSASLQERSNYLVVDIKGIRLAILAYTYGTNGIAVPKGQEFLVNMVNLPEITEDIRQVRALGVDVVLVFPHFGTEYSRVPGNKEKELVEQFFKAGADIVAGSHPHVLQPMLRRDTLEQEGMFLAYSLGNFISAQRDKYKDSGIILNLTLQKDLATGKIALGKTEYIPTWVQIASQNGRKFYRVVAVENAIRQFREGTDKTIRQRDYERLLQVWDETTKMLTGPAAPVLKNAK